MTKIFQAFCSAVEKFPGKSAIIHKENRISYSELAELVVRWSGAMVHGGVARGEHIGVVLPDCIEFAALMLCASKLGCVLVPVSPSLKPEAIRSAFMAARVKHVVAATEVLERINDSGMDFSFVSGMRISIGAVPIQQLLSGARQEASEEASDDDAFILLTTSGSTGAPKPIVLSQRNKWNRAMAAIELYSITSDDVTLAATPLYHSLAERLVLIPLITGGTSVIMGGFAPAEWLEVVCRNKVTFTIAVSSQLRLICALLTGKADSKTESLRCVVSSSALLEASVKAELVATLKCDLHECYGASEIAIASNLDGRAALSKLKSVGNAAPGVDIQILTEHGTFAATGEPGEIVCRTPMLFQGYFEKPELTAASMHGDYFRTGDVGRLDEDGFLYFLGRQKELVISGGINIYPSDIEDVLNAHASVRECAAFAYPDDNLGEVVAVAVVPEDRENFNLRTLRHYSAGLLADFQLPRKYFIIDELPRNAMGKITRRSLVEQYAQLSLTGKN